MTTRKKRLIAIDWDGTLMNSPEPLEGKEIWKEKKGEDYPHIGWWSKPESLDPDVFDIKPYPKLMEIITKGIHDPNTYVIILTNRMSKLRPEIEKLLALNNIQVDELDMKEKNRMTKGDRIMTYVEKDEDVTEVNVYDDRANELHDLMAIATDLEKRDIKYTVFKADQGTLTPIHEGKTVNEVINDEIEDFLEKNNN